MAFLFHRRPRPRLTKPFERPFLWSRQREIIESVYANPLTVVPACHGSGKSFCMAVLAADWVMKPEHPGKYTKVVILGPSHRQITVGILAHLREFRRAGQLPGHISLGTSPTWRLDGRDILITHSPPRGAGGLLQGIHAKHLLLIIEEGAEIERSQWDAAQSLLTGEENRAISVGNPTRPESAFYDACEKPGTQWNVIRLPVWDTPHFTGEKVPDYLLDVLPSQEWVDRMRREWTPAQQCARIDGDFPAIGSLAIFDMGKFPTADRPPPVKADAAGVDVAGEGRDRTAVFLFHRAERVVWELPVPNEYQSGDQLALSSWLAPRLAEYGVGQVLVDGLGPGSELGPPLQRRMPNAQVACVMTGDQAYDPGTYFNRRAEMHWAWAIRPPTLLNPDRELLEEFRQVRAEYGEGSRRKIEKKTHLMERLQRSPDRMDAALLAVAPVPDLEVLVV